jgi:hypothetical protein
MMRGEDVSTDPGRRWARNIQARLNREQSCNVTHDDEAEKMNRQTLELRETVLGK